MMIIIRKMGIFLKKKKERDVNIIILNIKENYYNLFNYKRRKIPFFFKQFSEYYKLIYDQKKN